MSTPRIEWNLSMFRKIRRSEPVASLVDTACEHIADEAGPLYTWSARQGKSRYRGIVYPVDYRGRVDNLRNNTLLKALGS